MVKKSILTLVAAAAVLFGATACKDTAQLNETTTLAGGVTSPSVAQAAAVRTRVAAKLTPVLQAHPALIPWANGFAQVAYSLAGIKLPAPAALQSAFAVAEIFAPDDIDSVLNSIMSVYQLDYPAAGAINTAAVPYLTLLGEGIQDAATAAKSPASP